MYNSRGKDKHQQAQINLISEKWKYILWSVYRRVLALLNIA